jgi:membrane protein DedA with SNARE-associated domain
MIPSWEPTALLALMSLVLAERALEVTFGIGIDCLVILAGALTAGWASDISWVLVACWVGVAVVAADQVARAGGRQSGRDPFALLGRSRSAPGYALASVVGAAGWSGGLVLGGRLLGEVGTRQPWLIVAVILLIFLVGGAVRAASQPPPASSRRRYTR